LPNLYCIMKFATIRLTGGGGGGGGKNHQVSSAAS
jgi:hypothetical protein